MRTLQVVITFGTAQAVLSALFFKEVRIHTATWHVENKKPPKDIKAFLGLDQIKKPDLIIVALQGVKIPNKISVEPTWRNTILSTLQSDRYNPTLLTTQGTLATYICHSQTYHKDVISNIKDVLSVAVSDKQNPDALITTIGWLGRRITTINSIFHGNETNVQRRFWEFYYIEMSRGMYWSEHIFWMGRLNFRVDKSPKEAKKLIDQKKFNDLLAADQLKKGQISKDVFLDWKEQEITFKPNYMFKQSSNEYDLSYTPSWTSRILFNTELNETLEEVRYQGFENYQQFTQRPVTADFNFFMTMVRRQ